MRMNDNSDLIDGTKFLTWDKKNSHRRINSDNNDSFSINSDADPQNSKRYALKISGFSYWF